MRGVMVWPGLRSFWLFPKRCSISQQHVPRTVIFVVLYLSFFLFAQILKTSTKPSSSVFLKCKIFFNYKGFFSEMTKKHAFYQYDQHLFFMTCAESNTNLCIFRSTWIHYTPFENAQRWMGKNTFHFLLLNDDNMIGEH